MIITKLTRREIESIKNSILPSAIEIHRQLGRQHFDPIYLQALLHELSVKNLQCETGFPVPMIYKGKSLLATLNCILVEEAVLVEIRSIDTTFSPMHTDYMLHMMRMMGAPMGLLLNFNCNNLFSEGQKCVVNSLYNERV